MDITQFLGMFQRSSPDELRKIFEGFRNRMRVISTAVQAYESARLTGRKDVISERLSAIKKEIEIVEWASLGKISDTLPIKSRTRFIEFQREYESVIVSLGELTANLDFPAPNEIRMRLASLSPQLDEFEGKSTRSSSLRRWLIAGTSVCLLIAGPTFLFFQYWSGDIEPDSFTLLFPAAPYGRHSVIASSSFASEQHGISVPERDEFMMEFSRFYFGHPNNFLDQNYEHLSPRKIPSSEVQHLPGSSNGMPMAAPEPATEAARSAPVAAPPPPESAISESGAAPASSENTLPKVAGDSPTSAPPAPNHKGPSVEKNVTVDAQTMQRERAYRWKILLRNSSLRSPRYVSSVRETIELVKEEPFPWTELRFAPILKLRCTKGKMLVEPPYLEFLNEGLGPAIAMNWRVTANKDVSISEGTQFLLGGRRLGRIWLMDSRDWGFVHVQKGGAAQRDEVLLHEGTPAYQVVERLPAGVPASNIETEKSPCFPLPLSMRTEKPFIKFGEKYLKRIRTIKELNEISEVVSKVHAELEYEDMKGDKRKITEDVRLPNEIRIFKWNEKLYRAPSCAAPAASAPLYFALANAFSPLPVKTTDRDALITNFDLDLSNLLPTARVTEATQFDANLAPLGHIAIFTTARCMRSGIYEITVDVNGDEEMKFRVRTLNPELRKFPSPQTNWLDSSQLELMRNMRWSEILWYRWRIGSEAEEDPSIIKLKDVLNVYPLDNVEGSAWFNPRSESPFEPVTVPPAAPAKPAPVPPEESAPKPAV